jgi:hypothetical protein
MKWREREKRCQTAENDLEGGAAAPCRVEVVEPRTLIIHQPPGGYPLENRQVQMTCAKSANVKIQALN